MIDAPRSRIYRGSLRHRRFLPRRHAFAYGVWMAWLDLDELPELFDGVPGFSARRPALARFRREDYLAPHDRPLDDAVREELARRLGFAPDGRICLLTQLRTLGVGFTPLSLYYAYDAHGELCAVLGEVTNTPWGERARYACAVSPHRHAHTAEFAKTLHVSPFHPMDMSYRWRFTTPGERLAMHMETWQAGQRHFDATLTLEGRPATRRVLLATLARQPWMSAKTLAGIHFEALRLWLKRVPVHDHPRREETSS
ncbi:DUF1365 domain-containing protein [Halomonas heilongjiangensis]|uniref:DUF1365 domain-containing protein n=1 Tax=Halomonas heilongjiangensis TaxID=1387883 RepID=A0A2N7TRU3_9GAMM|nr:DUF1365 domain-containing protein [Halomonas heilongjiangensis]PMR70924.1 DUF1365 domain-containing protein [Halomonas heilongjiangensis]PXX88262.1 hypothetical protein CR158_14710 [Halomonas heilongjiangensis]